MERTGSVLVFDTGDAAGFGKIFLQQVLSHPFWHVTIPTGDGISVGPISGEREAFASFEFEGRDRQQDAAGGSARRPHQKSL
jgi:hypothetical protein